MIATFSDIFGGDLNTIVESLKLNRAWSWRSGFSSVQYPYPLSSQIGQINKPYLSLIFYHNYVDRLNTHDQQIFRPSLFSGTLGFIRQTRDVIHISAKNRIMQLLCFQSPRLKLYRYSSRIKYNHLYFLVRPWNKLLMWSGNLRIPPWLEKGPRI